MKKLSRMVPVIVLGLAFLLSLLLVMNHTVLFGGDEGMILNALQPVLEGERLEVVGQLTLSPEGDDVDIMTMTIDIDGYIHASDLDSKIDFTLNQPISTDKMPLAQIVQSQEELWLKPEGEEIEPIDLGTFISEDALTEEALEKLWVKIYDKMTIEEVEEYDLRPDKGHLKTNLMNYQVDLMSLLGEEQIRELQEQLGMVNIGDVVVVMSIKVDNTGELAGVTVRSDVGVFDVDGWLAFEE